MRGSMYYFILSALCFVNVSNLIFSMEVVKYTFRQWTVEDFIAYLNSDSAKITTLPGPIQLPMQNQANVPLPKSDTGKKTTECNVCHKEFTILKRHIINTHILCIGLPYSIKCPHPNCKHAHSYNWPDTLSGHHVKEHGNRSLGKCDTSDSACDACNDNYEKTKTVLESIAAAIIKKDITSMKQVEKILEESDCFVDKQELSNRKRKKK